MSRVTVSTKTQYSGSKIETADERETKETTQKAGNLRGTTAPKGDAGARHPFQVAHVQRIQAGEDRRDAVKDSPAGWTAGCRRFFPFYFSGVLKQLSKDA